jgi:ubiquinone biosynthesis protein UbiJ
VAQAVREAGESARHFRDDTIDWLRDEARVTVPHPEMNAFLDDVDDLRERTERLAARIARLGNHKS